MNDFEITEGYCDGDLPGSAFYKVLVEESEEKVFETLEAANARYERRRDEAEKIRSQNPRVGCCACCGVPSESLIREHNHRTGKVRGWVCGSCNSQIGYYEWALKDEDRVSRVQQYLRDSDPVTLYQLASVHSRPPAGLHTGMYL